MISACYVATLLPEDRKQITAERYATVYL
jgi:hypothetical protein